MPLVSTKFNPRLERLKVNIEGQLGRRLTEHEEYLIELSAVLLDDDEPEQEQGQAKNA